MSIFGKKKEEEYDDEDDLVEEERADRKLTRKFKDLDPQNKKKRKEPPKPWGKKERVTVLIVMLTTLVVAGILAITARGLSSPQGIHVSSINLPKINFGELNIFKEETIEIKKK